MNDMDVWKGIKNLYKEKFNIPTRIIDFIAVYDILLRCVQGFSNTKISKYSKLDADYISEVLMEYFLFEGWNSDLDFSPIAVYNRNEGIRINYLEEVKTITGLCDELCLDFTYSICKRFNYIKKEINKYYGSKDRPT